MHLAWRLLAAVWVLLVQTSCATVGLHHWALDRVPRSEVVAFVDREAECDLLLVALDGEPGFEDGLWAFAVRPLPLPGASLASVASLAGLAPKPERVPEALETRVLERARRTGNTARLADVRSGAQVDWILIDAWSGTLAAPRPIDDPNLRTYLSLDGKARDADGARATLVGVHVRRTVREQYDDLGTALLPPARRVKSRLLPAAVLAPFALAVDLVLLPIEAVVFLFIAAQVDPGAMNLDLGGSFST